MADQQPQGPVTPAGWVDTPWDGSAGRWADSTSYCSACLLDLNPPGKAKVKTLCALPYKEPDGRVNVRGVLACAGGYGITRVEKPDGVDAAKWAAARRGAARKLVSMYGRMRREPPEAVSRIAGG